MFVAGSQRLFSEIEGLWQIWYEGTYGLFQSQCGSIVVSENRNAPARPTTGFFRRKSDA